MVLIAVVGVVTWLMIGIGLPEMMARRGYDRTAWRVVSLLLGPVALLLASLERLSPIARPAEIVDRGARRPHGSLALLVVRTGGSLDDVAATIQRRERELGRLTLARVLPFDGAKDVEREAGETLRAERSHLGCCWAELVLLFGLPDDAIARFALNAEFDAVLVDADLTSIDDALAGRAAALRHAGRALDGHLPDESASSL